MVGIVQHNFVLSFSIWWIHTTEPLKVSSPLSAKTGSLLATSSMSDLDSTTPTTRKVKDLQFFYSISTAWDKSCFSSQNTLNSMKTCFSISPTRWTPWSMVHSSEIAARTGSTLILNNRPRAFGQQSFLARSSTWILITRLDSSTATTPMNSSTAYHKFPVLHICAWKPGEATSTNSVNGVTQPRSSNLWNRLESLSTQSTSKRTTSKNKSLRFKIKPTQTLPFSLVFRA